MLVGINLGAVPLTQAVLAVVALLPLGEGDVCSNEHASCQETRCCWDNHLRCYGKTDQEAYCETKCNPGDDWTCNILDPHTGQDFEDRWKGRKPCTSRFVAPKPPVNAMDHNGVTLPPTCFNGTGPHHIFVIGDWGGVLPGQAGNDGDTVKPADHTRPEGSKHRQFVWGIDDVAQEKVASAMAARAKTSNPEFVISAGAAAWRGLGTHCGEPIYRRADFGPYEIVFENFYQGQGIDGKQWLGVLGNHDYGGWKFTGGWDHAIGYTWGGGKSTGRWMMPAQYWAASAHYPDFSADFYFLDSNVWDAHEPENPSEHNICSFAHSDPDASCSSKGPRDPRDCPWWFKNLWNSGKTWLREALARSNAEWQIVVTHFPPTWGAHDWQADAQWHGIDLMITGHVHNQQVHYLSDTRWQIWTGLWEDFLAPTAWIVVGGGGGVTSEDLPDVGGADDQYGFMDLTLTKYNIRIEAISHGGQVRSVTNVKPRPPSIPAPSHAQRVPMQEDAEGCPMIEPMTFFVYRAQDDSTYPDRNINAASLAGVLWYLHHEVVIVCPRKFGITRIRRLKVTVKNSCDLWKAKKTRFGPYVAFDSGKCHIDGCNRIWERYGAVVGCQHIPFNTGVFAAYCMPPKCRYAHWYSFPGDCPQQDVGHKTPSCNKEHPGGFCEHVTGARDCTYNIEDAGEVRLDELYQFSGCGTGQMEYNNQTDRGVGLGFWDGIYNRDRCTERLEAVIAKFKAKYPDTKADADEPWCDFYESDPKDYFFNTGSGFGRQYV